MNFLEQLAAEWYEYKGYFVRANVKYGKNYNGGGGHIGEFDVLAYNPETKEIKHIECSTDSSKQQDREARFKKKFLTATKYYDEIFKFDHKKIERIAIVGFHGTKYKADYGDNVKIITIPDFMKEIIVELREKNPAQDAIPESYLLLRAVQYGTFYFKK